MYAIKDKGDPKEDSRAVPKHRTPMRDSKTFGKLQEVYLTLYFITNSIVPIRLPKTQEDKETQFVVQPYRDLNLEPLTQEASDVILNQRSRSNENNLSDKKVQVIMAGPVLETKDSVQHDQQPSSTGQKKKKVGKMTRLRNWFSKC